MWKGRIMGKSIIGHLVYSHAKGTFPRKGLLRKMSPNEVNCIGLTFISWQTDISRTLVALVAQHPSLILFVVNYIWVQRLVATTWACKLPSACLPPALNVQSFNLIFVFTWTFEKWFGTWHLYLQGLCSLFTITPHFFFACLETPTDFLWYFAKFLSLKVLPKRQPSRWAVLVELSHTPPLLSHWALSGQKFPTWEMMIYISISLRASLHHPIHFATAGHRCASLRKTLSHFQLALLQ